MSRVAALTVAPVKGLSTVPRAQIRLEADGVADDRRMFLLRPDGAIATLRSHPALTSVVPDLDLAAGRVSVTMADGAVHTSELNGGGSPVTARLYGKNRDGNVVEGAVADALSSYVGERLRLVLAPRTGVGWDEGPVSLIGQASIAAVGTPDVRAEDARARFRMLVEIDGTEPYEEDTWTGRRVRIGDAVVEVEQPLGRCVIITQSPRSGEPDWKGLRRLADLRGKDHVDLGVIAAVREPGEIRLGDAVTLLP